ncbi:pyridoxamine 5'-phosphate oxidase family protein [Loktanella sp. IMCC34160]|uniref:pyridoxamine 5'-phosphate oxidase family protein n=1 Tax=Loktanella sp. IMCC34160 TaxID=2510646 RepID=UPI00101C6183|nr:pyridoxamine 5'-phosphate oxidase family protein [Loktanella sp. IMCC34160]RYG89468.1 pyridoxamine 5'-phosphate oxidase family protein [Loktanella sp. IMCC34160]
MKIIDTLDALETLYGTPSQLSLTKVATRLTPLYRKWIDASRFVVLTTVGPEGTDGSPRGDDGAVVRIADDQTIHLPDWQGNNRLDSLKNIVTDGRVSLMFMVPGSTNVVRVNGTAVITDDPEITASFERKGMHPKSVIVVTVAETYFQCAKAVMRSGLWTRDDTAGLPTAGQFLKEMEASFDADGYDGAYPEYAKTKMW